MNSIRRLMCLALVFALSGMGFLASAQTTYRVSNTQVERLLNRIDNRAGAYRRSLDIALDQSRIDGTRREDNINGFVSDFESATTRLRDRFNNRRVVNSDVEDVLNRAVPIDTFMRNHRLGQAAERDWANLKNDLNELARLYNVTWNWSAQTYPGQTYPQPTYPTQGQAGGRPYNSLTGTFRLDPAQSDDARAAADRAVRNTRSRNRQQAVDTLTARLEAPEMIAIDRRGRTVTIASSRASQITFDADGTERTEQLGNGRNVRVRASLSGDSLTISSTGDRGNDFSVTFEPFDGGRRLRITRRVTTNDVYQPVTVASVYDRTSNVAQLDLNNGYPNYPGNTQVGGNFIVADGTQMTATLNDTLSTKTARDNDRFTMTVVEPSQYRGAVIEGYVTDVKRSGRVTGRSQMTLNFDTIRLPNGNSHRFAGFVDSVRTASGEVVRVDNEGSVQEGDSRGSTTVKRAAIGTAVGAIIGAIAGGGKGAAIGAAIGAGAGAGSVYVQGSDDLELLNGSEVTVRASAPRS